MSRRSERTKPVALLAVAAVVVLGIAGCSRSDSTSGAGNRKGSATSAEQQSTSAPGQPGATGEPAAPTAEQERERREAVGGGAPGTGEQAAVQVSDQELRQHARARRALAQKAPDAFRKLRTSKDPGADLVGADRQKAEQALQGTGVTFDQFARVQRAITSDPQVRQRYTQLTQRTGARPAARSGTTAGAGQSPEAAPAASPR